jgi:hypothetical protein
MESKSVRKPFVALMIPLLMAMLSCNTLMSGLQSPDSGVRNNGDGGCIAHDGKYEGIVSFTVDHCVVKNLVLYLTTGGGGGKINITMIYAKHEIPIQDDKFTYHDTPGGGELTILGEFTSPTLADGRYILGEGTKIGLITVLERIDSGWAAEWKS